MIEDIKMGIYRHYKGPLYQVYGLAHDANVEGRITVAYFGLELTQAHIGPRFAFRDITDFQTTVDSGIQRFTYLGPYLTEEMIKP